MAPKKKGGKKKKKADDSAEMGGPMDPEQVAKMYKSAVTSLQLQLADRSDEAAQAVQARRELHERVDQIQNELTEKDEDVYRIKRDMTRQYKSMEEELVQKINMLEKNVLGLREDLESKQKELEDTIKQKDSVIEEKNKQIDEMQNQMESMAQEFGEMLKETLDKMRERIELNSTNFDQEDSNVPIKQRMEEFLPGYGGNARS
mmetsp:Transcript_1985/g.2659  ORF Transcript_1985/g.2659 Transcript_1985/m.2659 type:complete len:203 (+) Transcript_1985:99-707(+)